jgi:flagellar assembly factor FliW
MNLSITKAQLVQKITSTNDYDTNEEQQNLKIIESRFGKITIDTEKAIFFPKGLLGMANKTNFCLTQFPNPAYSNFNILQSIDDENLAFIIFSLGGVEAASSLLEKEDLIVAAELLDIDLSDMVILLITSVNKNSDSEDPKALQVSVNLRAPLIVNSDNYLGLQYVFNNEKYSIQHIIN